MLTLLTGGARSGKSRAAVRLAEATGSPVTFVATARPADEEMAARIERHRRERPAGWSVAEEPVDVLGPLDLADADATVVVDCLSLWVTNQLDERDEVILGRADALAEAARTRAGATFVVTNEVGAGIVPDNPLARRFRDLLGEVNQIIGGRADRVLLCVAGRVLALPDGEGAP